MDPMKLIAFDHYDIEVVSTHVQDSVVKISDIVWRPAENRFVLAMNRFDWESANGSDPCFRRRRSALRFDRVMACKCRNVSPVDKEAVLNLLAVEFAETTAPGGIVTLFFSGGGALRLEVECLECELADLGPAWTTTCCPAHPDDATAVTADAAKFGRGTSTSGCPAVGHPRRGVDLSFPATPFPVRSAAPPRRRKRCRHADPPRCQSR